MLRKKAAVLKIVTPGGNDFASIELNRLLTAVASADAAGPAASRRGVNPRSGMFGTSMCCAPDNSRNVAMAEMFATALLIAADRSDGVASSLSTSFGPPHSSNSALDLAGSPG